MRTLLISLLALMLAAPIASADDKAAEPAEVTIEGEVLDLGCYNTRLASGPEHQECAARCLKNGNPAGLLTDEGVVYTITGAAPAFERFAAQRVRLTGSARGSLLKAVSMQVLVDDQWQDVPMTRFGSPEEVESGE